MLSQENARIILKSLKKDYGITYTDISKNIGISKSQLSMFLDNRRNLKRDKLYKLENYLKILKGAESNDLQFTA